jgi:DNA-binding PadR family transcriptional regulator
VRQQHHRRNPLALAVLALLYERPMHPYEVAQTLRQRHKHESIRLNYGSLYGVVEGLERRRLVEARATVREGKRPERTVYGITERGLRELVDWMSELVSTPTKEYPQFEAALSLLPALPPDLAVELLEQRVLNLDVILTQKRAAVAATAEMGLPRLFVLENEYAIAMLAAERDHTAALAAEVAAGTLDGIEEWRTWFGPDSTVFDPAGDHLEPDGGDESARFRAPWADAAAARRRTRELEESTSRALAEVDELRAQAKRTKAAAKEVTADVKAAAKATVRRPRRRPSDG